jgi:hypothetical protein
MLPLQNENVIRKILSFIFKMFELNVDKCWIFIIYAWYMDVMLLNWYRFVKLLFLNLYHAVIISTWTCKPFLIEKIYLSCIPTEPEKNKCISLNHIYFIHLNFNTNYNFIQIILDIKIV